MIKGKNAKILGLFTIFFIILSAAGCGRKEGAAEKEKIVPVKVEKVRLQDIKQTLDYVGDIMSEEQALIYSRVNGKIIEKIKEDGSRVSKGEVIAYVDRDEVGFQFEKAPVESPIDGVIGRFYTDKGVNVTTQTPIALVVDMDNVEIDLDIPGRYFPKVSIGQTAEISVDAYPDKKFNGKVAKVSPIVDLDTRTAPVEILASNPGHLLKPGMFASVELTIDTHKRKPAVLKEAVLGREPSLYVYIVKDGIARRRYVKLGLQQEAYFEVESGLKEAEAVVVLGQQNLRDGAKVNVIE